MYIYIRSLHMDGVFRMYPLRASRLQAIGHAPAAQDLSRPEAADSDCFGMDARKQRPRALESLEVL